MSNRTTRAQIARQTVEILERGDYGAPTGETISIRDALTASRTGTRLYAPEHFDEVLASVDGRANRFVTQIYFENCTTLSAARRLVHQDPSIDPLCLNFASAKHPGGGFLSGSQAQEESLARATGLYACIEPVGEYYAANHRSGTSLYTHHMIYSPRVPVFRDDADELQPQPFQVSIITAPAVNAGAVRQNEPHQVQSIEPLMCDRIERVLAIGLAHRHDTLVLGAWGCGVFKNDPAKVAGWFYAHLVKNERFQGAFRAVVFAVLDRSDGQETWRAFHEQFSSPNAGM